MTEMALFVKGNIPASLQSDAAEKARQEVEDIIAQGEKPSSSKFKYTVYGAADVRQQIRTDQSNRCAYCGDFMRGSEVEHYRPKTEYINRKGGTEHRPAYYWLAYSWENLIGACHLCNRQKGTYFPLRDERARKIDGKDHLNEEPLILNPYLDDISKSIEYFGHLIRPKRDENGNENEKGKVTIELLGLNDREDLKECRLRSWKLFLMEKEEKQLSYQDAYQLLVQRYQKMGLAEKDIEFLEMYKYQVLQ